MPIYRFILTLALMFGQMAMATAVETISTAIGSVGDGGPAFASRVNTPLRAVVDPSGNIFFSDCFNRRVRKISATTGVITTVAGNGQPGSAGLDGLAINANVEQPSGVALDGFGNLYISDRGIRNVDEGNHRIYKVEAATGILRLVAGNGSMGNTGDGGLATAASFNFPTGLAVDGSGNVFICDQNNHRVRKVTAATGIITTVAGTGTAGFFGDGASAIAAMLNRPAGMTVDALGNLYIAEEGNQRIRKVAAATGIITTIAGTGTYAFSGDGGQATAAGLATPSDVKIDGSGNLYVADADNARIRKISAGIISTIVGNGFSAPLISTGSATATPIGLCYGLAISTAGDLIIPSTSQRLFRFNATANTVSIIAGAGTSSAATPLAATLVQPLDIAIDAAGNRFVADARANRVLKVTPGGQVTTVAGTGDAGFSGDGGVATSAKLYWPQALAFDSGGNLLIADSYNYRIRKVNAVNQVITTVVGNGTQASTGDGGLATAAQISFPHDIAVGIGGHLFIAESGYRIRRIAADTGIITTYAGSGVSGGAGDGGLATSAQIEPRAITFDTAGNLYIADQTNLNQRIRKVATGTQVITAELNVIAWSLLWDNGTMLLGTGNYQVSRWTPGGALTVVAGMGTWGLSGDGGAAIAAQMGTIRGLAMTAQGNLLLSDGDNGRIRQVTFNPTAPGGGTPPSSGASSGGGCGLGGGAATLVLLLSGCLGVRFRRSPHE